VVSLRDDAGALHFEVADDGRGFDTATAKKGAGLTNMSDRVDALAGFVEVTSRAGAGTRIRGSVPVPDAVVAA
jgi:signal transduction histidine kinase